LIIIAAKDLILRLGEFEGLNGVTNSEKSEQICRVPHLKYIGHEETWEKKNCSIKENFGSFKNNTWYINKNIANSLTEIKCAYRVIDRKDDFKLIIREWIPLEDGDVVKEEVMDVFCTAVNKTTKLKFDMLFAQVVDKLPDKKETPNLHKPDKHGCTPMNVMLLSYDSVSRVSWTIRQKKSLKYMLDEMNFQILNGYNIIGDGTPAGWTFQSKCIHFENKKTNILFCSINSDLYR
jgi:hypothetical protein